MRQPDDTSRRLLRGALTATAAAVAAAAFGVTLRVGAPVATGPQAPDVITLSVDSIEFRDDLTRLYGRIEGAPHRADRIDLVTMIPDGSEAALLSTDVDGVDFRRWFQFEDEPSIPFELDFGPMDPLRGGFTLEVKSPKGVLGWHYDCLTGKNGK
ncbi:MAG: hypothetical protein NC336_06190 [Clostridium sp.]|nr:hypothetical protein [Clostridium sp.]